MIKDQALGLPKGSVRALAFLMLIATICAGAVWGPIDSKDFMPLVTMAFGYYFGQKVGKSDV